MADHLGEQFVKDYLSHAYDPQKAHEYYERTKKLKGRGGAKFTPTPKGRKSGTTGTSPTQQHRANAIATKAAAGVGPQRTAAIQKLADAAKEELHKLTNDFQDWVNKHPKASPQEKSKQRDAAINRKNDVINKLKSDVAKISSAASSKTKVPGGTEGRHH